uniref:Uncharacterized protein n=1 Tax=Anguilla anguilla TaxID=7936 RepID=A0A0E9WQ83_ANGAN
MYWSRGVCSEAMLSQEGSSPTVSTITISRAKTQSRGFMYFLERVGQGMVFA